ncbi:ThuA domain-containing protein [Chloroflexota bacterium]
MRILVLCDDTSHPAQVLQKGLAGLEEYGFEFDWVEDAHDWSVEQIAAYPAVILSKMNNFSSSDETPWMTENVQGAFLKYVQNGNSLLALHSGTAGYEQASVLRALLGGVFREHPDQCPVTVKPLVGHPLIEGSKTFTLVDEHYMMDLDDEQADVFLHTKSEHGTQPGGWRRYEGNGRVCVLTPGHNLEVLEHPSYQALLCNALRWCSKIL